MPRFNKHQSPYLLMKLLFLNSIFKAILYSPIIFTYCWKRKNHFIEKDLDAAEKLCKWHRRDSRFLSYLNFICFLPEYRAVYLYRLGRMGNILSIIYSNKLLLFIHTSNIGGGLFIQHGHSTRIEAESIGENCQIWQNVTIGKKFSGGMRPRIGNNVKICTGACVLGDIHIGDNVTVGANAVVLSHIPDNCIAVGIPARIINNKE